MRSEHRLGSDKEEKEVNVSPKLLTQATYTGNSRLEEILLKTLEFWFGHVCIRYFFFIAIWCEAI